MSEEEKRVLVPRASRVQRVISGVLLVVSAALLYYAWWGWQQL